MLSGTTQPAQRLPNCVRELDGPHFGRRGPAGGVRSYLYWLWWSYGEVSRHGVCEAGKCSGPLQQYVDRADDVYTRARARRVLARGMKVY